MTTIKYFIDKNNENPVRDFLNENKLIKNKAFNIFSNIEKYGLISVIPHIKKMSGLPFWEIRILGKDKARIIYVSKIKDEILLLHAFKKKSQKTPLKDINIALKRYKQST